MITWDESKRRLNLKRHKIDIAEVESAFDSPMLTDEDDREDYGELRLQSLAFWRDRVVFIVWTDREQGPHIISCRYAEPSETKDYFSIL
jgi:uncharacterized DUF497 family protein